MSLSTRLGSTSPASSRSRSSQGHWPSGCDESTSSWRRRPVELADLQFFNDYVIHNLVSGLATADAAHRVLTFNQSAVQITGHELANVTGQPVAEVLQLPAEFMAIAGRRPGTGA